MMLLESPPDYTLHLHLVDAFIQSDLQMTSSQNQQKGNNVQVLYEKSRFA